jgi:hypothetical protein
MDLDADPGFPVFNRGDRGVARPKNVGAVGETLQRVARDIRSMYTLGYVPSPRVPTKAAKSAQRGELRRVSVDVQLPSGQKLAVRTRRAYLAGAEEVQRDDR